MSKRAPLSFNTEKVVPAIVTPVSETRLFTNAQTNKKIRKRATVQMIKQNKEGKGGNLLLGTYCQKPPNSSNY